MNKFVLELARGERLGQWLYDLARRFAGSSEPVEFPELGFWAVHIRNQEHWAAERQPVNRFRHALEDSIVPSGCDSLPLIELIGSMEWAQSIYIVDQMGAVTVFCSPAESMFYESWRDMTDAWYAWDRHRQRLGMFKQTGLTHGAFLQPGNHIVQFSFKSDHE